MCIRDSFASVPPAPAAQLTQEKGNQQIQQDRTNDTNRKQWSNQTVVNRDVRQVQTALRSRGFDPGPVDGVMGSKTTMAIRNFQLSQGLTPSGMMDEATMNALHIQSATDPTTNARNSTVPPQQQFPNPT